MWSSDDAGNFIICIKLMCLTSNTQPALSRFTSSRDSALVGSFIKLGDTGDDHVSFIAGPDVGAMFVEISYVTCGIVLLQRRVTAFPSVTGWMGISRITAPADQYVKNIFHCCGQESKIHPHHYCSICIHDLVSPCWL